MSLAPDLVTMVQEFGDVDGARKAKLAAIERGLLDNQFFDDDGNSGSFHVTHKGVTYEVSDIRENNEGETYHESGTFWSYGHICCRVLRTHGFTRYNHNYFHFDESEKLLATSILNLMDDERNCSLCGALFPEDGCYKGHAICPQCALSELPKKCCTCRKIHGRNLYPAQSTERPEHPMCKKRRLG